MVKWLYSKNNNHHPKGENQGGQINDSRKAISSHAKKS